MKNNFVLIVIFSSTLAFSLESSIVVKSNKDQYFSPDLDLKPDLTWPSNCPIPECEKIQRALKYPSPQKRFFYQCINDGKRWIPQLVPCPCDLIFVYQTQTCSYPWNIQEWCDYDYVVDIRPVSCDGFELNHHSN